MAFTNYASYAANMSPVEKAIYIDSLAQGNSNIQYKSDPSTLPPPNFSQVQNDIWNATPYNNAPVQTKSNSNPTPPSDQNDADIMAKIDEYYNQGVSRINSQISNLQGQKGNYETMATAPYESQIPLVNQASQQGQNAITNQTSQAQMQEQNALASARKLYNELTQRNRQAFGSGALGSLGQAAGEVLGRSSMEQFGNIRNTAGETYQTLSTAMRDLQDKTAAQLQSIEYQKQAALAQARAAFNERIQYLNDKKGELGQNRSIDKLDELRSLRDYTRQIEDQARALQQQIQLQNNSAMGWLQDQLNGANQNSQYYSSMGQNAVGTQGVNSNNSLNGIGRGNALGGDPNQSNINTTLYGYNPVVTPNTKRENPFDRFGIYSG